MMGLRERSCFSPGIIAVVSFVALVDNAITSVAFWQVYVDFIAVGMLLLGGVLASYGLLLYMEMSKVRAEQASPEIWKVHFAVVALSSNICT